MERLGQILANWQDFGRELGCTRWLDPVEMVAYLKKGRRTSRRCFRSLLEAPVDDLKQIIFSGKQPQFFHDLIDKIFKIQSTARVATRARPYSWWLFICFLYKYTIMTTLSTNRPRSTDWRRG